MLSAKPVVTCRDSGGPLEFVKDGETGFVTEPRRQPIAAVLERLLSSPKLASDMGHNGLMQYKSMKITWSHVVETLLADIRLKGYRTRLESMA